MKFLFLSLLLALSLASISQVNYQDSLVTVHGNVKDSVFNVGFYDLVVVNKSVGKGIFGNSDGSFSITVKKKDKIGISVVGYQTLYISFADSSYKKRYSVNLFIESLEYTSETVIVVPIKTLDQLKEERQAIAKRETPVVTVSNAISSPITALYIAFSKREKTKRRIAEMEFQDQQDDVVREILRLYVHNDIVDLSSADYDEFIRFLHLNTEFLKRATDYELITYIQEKFEHFEKIKEGF
ncbi:MAG: hypothetical protein ACI857_003403 [Arenicella sp.]|jgi:hypothetical protein